MAAAEGGEVHVVLHDVMPRRCQGDFSAFVATTVISAVTASLTSLAAQKLHFLVHRPNYAQHSFWLNHPWNAGGWIMDIRGFH